MARVPTRDAPRKILVVESEGGLRHYLRARLHELGAEVIVCPGPSAPEFACAGTSAYGCPLAESVDVIILDLELESDLLVCGVAAWELLQYYRSLGKPIVVLSGRRDTIVPEAGDRIAVLRRPPDPDVLARAIRVLTLPEPPTRRDASDWDVEALLPGERGRQAR